MTLCCGKISLSEKVNRTFFTAKFLKFKLKTKTIAGILFANIPKCTRILLDNTRFGAPKNIGTDDKTDYLIFGNEQPSFANIINLVFDLMRIHQEIILIIHFCDIRHDFFFMAIFSNKDSF